MKFFDTIGFKGFVVIHRRNIKSGSKLLVAKSNLVVYTGREWALSKILNVEDPNISTNHNNFISWISFGNGAATAADPFNPTPPNSGDTSITEVVVDAKDTNLYKGNKLPLNNANYSTTITYMKDNNLDNKYLISQVNCLLNKDQANDQIINESALWISNSYVATDVTSMSLFSHVSFPSFKKTNEFEYILSWFIHS